jgi:hypothetical protein
MSCIFGTKLYNVNMKNILLSSFAAIILVVATGFSFEEHPEKQKNTNHFSVASKAASINGALTSGDVFNRPGWSGAVDLNCNGGSADLSTLGNAVYYSVYEIYSPDGENLIASVSSGFDSYLLLYCDPFDPQDPLSNLRFGDDDDGIGYDAAFLPTDNVYLEPYTSYFLVVTPFRNGTTGAYELSVDGGVLFGTPDPPPVPLSLLALGLTFVLIGVARLFLFRI